MSSGKEEFFYWEKGDVGQLSKNFSKEEMTCKGKTCGCTTQKISKRLIEQLQILRQLCGQIKVTSAYRCLKHNRSIGSKDTSAHVRGIAVDIKPVGTFLAPVFKDALHKLTRQAEDMGVFNGIGYAKNFTHLDLRAKKTRWKY